MKLLYISTDIEEANSLMDSNGLKNCSYYTPSEETAKRIGFNPISSVSFNGNTPYKTIEAIALSLAEKGLFTAIESFATIKKILPNDMKVRNKLLTIALSSGISSRKGHHLFLYSNNPSKIRKY